MTLSFALFPMTILNPLAVFFKNREKNYRQKFIGLLKFEPLGDFVRCFYFLRKSINFRKGIESVNYKKNDYRMFKSRVAALKVDILETVLKCFTQGILQLYVVYRQNNLDELNKIGLLQKASIIIGIVHLLWILMSISLERKIFLAVLGVTLLLADVGSDIFLFGEYLWEEQYFYAFFTFTFVIAASIFTTYDSPRRRKVLPINSLKNALICVPIVIFNLEPIIEAIKSIYFRLKMIQNFDDSKCENYNGKRRQHKIDATQLKFFETIGEAAPQVTLQVSILLSSTLKGYKFNFRVAVQLISIVTSFTGFGVGILSLYNAMLVYYERDKMSKLGTVLMFFWYFPIIVSRILSIGMTASISPLSMVIFIGAHWMFSLLYLLYEWRENTVLDRIMASIGGSIRYTFIPDPVESKIGIVVVSSILGIENLCLVFYVIFFASFEELSVSASYKSNVRTFYHILSVINIFSGVLGTSFMVIYNFVLKYHVSLSELRNNSLSNT